MCATNGAAFFHVLKFIGSPAQKMGNFAICYGLIKEAGRLLKSKKKTRRDPFNEFIHLIRCGNKNAWNVVTCDEEDEMA